MNSYRRYRDALIVAVLLAVPFFFLRASIRDPRELNAIDRAVMRISAPIQYVSSLLAREVSNLWGNYVYLVEVKADHQRLEYENARLKDRVRRNMPVIGLDGVVGKVQRVSGDRVDVLLAVDSGSGIDVVDELTGARGFV